jgi:lipid-binding SYLF domain-containing protein
MKRQALTAVAGLLVLGIFGSAACYANSKAELNASAAAAITHFYTLSPMNKQLADKAAGILIFSHVTKGGAGVAGEFGEGVLQLKGETVDYYSVGSASVGLTLGYAEHSEIIMFMTPKSLHEFTHSGKWSVGADAAVAMMQQGAGGQYDSATLNKPVLGFVFGEKGLIGDLSLEGSKVTKIKTIS